MDLKGEKTQHINLKDNVVAALQMFKTFGTALGRFAYSEYLSAGIHSQRVSYPGLLWPEKMFSLSHVNQ